jgi:hypothetical protein
MCGWSCPNTAAEIAANDASANSNGCMQGSGGMLRNKELGFSVTRS